MLCHFRHRLQLRIKHLVFEARQRYELIFEHIDSQIRRILGDTCPAVSGRLFVRELVLRTAKQPNGPLSFLCDLCTSPFLVELYRKHTIQVLQAIDFDKGRVGLRELGCSYMCVNKTFRLGRSKHAVVSPRS